MHNTTGAFELCELCGEPLDADNCYGEDDFPLCRGHHELFGRTVAWMVRLAGTQPEQPTQPELFAATGREATQDGKGGGR